MSEVNGTMNGRQTTPAHGRQQRKQLADQLDRFDKMSDRLDTIIDALAEALPGAVADACKEGARAAVKDAIIEILATPELRTLIVPARPEPLSEVQTVAPAPQQPQRKPNHWDLFKAKIAAARAVVTRAAVRAKDAMVRPLRAIHDAVVGIGKTTGEVLPVRRILVTTLGVGVVVAVICYLVPQEVAAGLSGVSAAFTTLAVQTGNWLNRAARRFGLVT
jgi:hypothetical protein